ncbi:MAG: flagellar export chaperone FliS [Terriglobia bacterium]
MTLADPRKAYRHASIQGGSLPDVFIQAYDRVALLLHSAAGAIEARDIEKKTADLNLALEIIFRLQDALNFEKGGEVAQTLNLFYSLIWREIMKGSIKLDAGIIRQAAGHVAEVRKVWEQALALSSAAAPDAVSAAPPNTHSHRPSAAAVFPTGPLQEPSSPSGSWTA